MTITTTRTPPNIGVSSKNDRKTESERFRRRSGQGGAEDPNALSNVSARCIGATPPVRPDVPGRLTSRTHFSNSSPHHTHPLRYRSKIKAGKRLHEREMQYREDVITMIVAEEEWCAEQLVKMASRIGRYYAYI